ncbi:MAG: MlaD family protein [Thermodesulfobacteriota bacterium]
MTTRFTIMERSVGLFILLAFLSFLTTVIMVGRGQNWFRKHNVYWAVYNEGYNIQPGVKVKLLRADIGQVTKVELTEDNKVRVNMRILADYASRIRTDSKAAVESPTLIGSEYINIIPGADPQAGLIPPGGQIPAREQKKIADYLEEFDFEHKLLLAEETLEYLSDLTEALSNPRGPLLGTLENLRRLTAQIQEGRGTLGRVVREDEIYDKIVKDLDTLDSILANIDEAAKSVKTGAKSVERGAASVEKGARSTKEVTAELEERIPAILTKVQAVLDDLETAMGEAPEISQDARQGMRDVNQILESIKKNFLIRSHLPRQPVPETHGVEIRGE